jgi:hypothetical protein
MTWEMLCELVWLPDYAGCKAQALEELRAHPEVDTVNVAFAEEAMLRLADEAFNLGHRLSSTCTVSCR